MECLQQGAKKNGTRDLNLQVITYINTEGYLPIVTTEQQIFFTENYNHNAAYKDMWRITIKFQIKDLFV